MFCLALAPLSILAQRPHGTPSSAPAPCYNIADDVSLQGTVLSYAENSKTPPLGAHLVLQTSSGNFEVHLGDARLLHAANLNLTQGANVRIVGQSQMVGSNSVFFARLVQVGTQVLAVRSSHGVALSPTTPRFDKTAALTSSSSPQAGAR
jgi:hypothetical protein